MKMLRYYNNESLQQQIEDDAKSLGLDKKIVEIIYSKGYRTKEKINSYINAENEDYVSSFKLANMQEVVNKIKSYAVNKKKVLVFGDYDVDGVSATYVMITALRALGINAQYFLPNRFEDGYGLTTAVIDKVIAKFNMDAIITVDCGITCVDEVEYCKSKGIDIIITDHHEIPVNQVDTLVINPKLKNQEYDFDGLCGTGVAFKIAQALLGEENCEFLLSVVAIATIADIVPLKNENRVIVKKGLKLMQEHLPYGLKQLIKDNKLLLKNINSTDIAFKIAPKLNACGRLGDASVALELYFENDIVKIKELIKKISELNIKRQKICNDVYDDCVEMLQNENLSDVSAIILKNDTWDSGILGIVCSRLVETYNRPVILFAKVDGVLKGSARSMNEVNIHEILKSVSDILEVFGGHKVAAGLTLKECNFDLFRERVNSFILTNVNNKVFMPVEYYDIEVKIEDINKEFFNQLKLLEPCGCENTKPRFLLKTGSLAIYPLKNNSPHCNLVFHNRLSLIFFNYIKSQAKLNFCKSYKFIFELQDYISGTFKGIVKSFDGSNEIKETSFKYLDTQKINQLTYTNESKIGNDNNNVEEYDDLLPFVMECAANVYGTCFVSFDCAIYQNFISKYSVSNIFYFDFMECNNTGANTIKLCPTDLDFAKHYKKIVFLDNVYDTSFLNKLKSLTTAKIYFPKNNIEFNNIFKKVSLDFKDINEFKGKLMLVQNNKFVSCISVYKKLVKDIKFKISFEAYMAYFSILKQLNIIETSFQDDFFVFKVTDIKANYKTSLIYNTINLWGRL